MPARASSSIGAPPREIQGLRAEGIGFLDWHVRLDVQEVAFELEPGVPGGCGSAGVLFADRRHVESGRAWFDVAGFWRRPRAIRPSATLLTKTRPLTSARFTVRSPSSTSRRPGIGVVSRPHVAPRASRCSSFGCLSHVRGVCVRGRRRSSYPWDEFCGSPRVGLLEGGSDFVSSILREIHMSQARRPWTTAQ